MTEEKKYFEAFVIESRGENRDLKAQLLSTEKQTMEHIKKFAVKYHKERNEAAQQKTFATEVKE